MFQMLTFWTSVLILTLPGFPNFLAQHLCPVFVQFTSHSLRQTCIGLWRYGDILDVLQSRYSTQSLSSFLVSAPLFLYAPVLLLFWLPQIRSRLCKISLVESFPTSDIQRSQDHQEETEDAARYGGAFAEMGNMPCSALEGSTSDRFDFAMACEPINFCWFAMLRTLCWLFCRPCHLQRVAGNRLVACKLCVSPSVFCLASVHDDVRYWSQSF